jgi:cbb3-type cytochrome oxidase subunit 1
MATQILTAKPVIASRLPGACFKIGSFTALIGVSLGIYMGISHDHNLAPVHVHLNLIGWVSMFLFGLFYKAYPAAIGKIAIAQVLLSTVGYIAMLGGLAGLLITAHPAFQPLTVVGSLTVWAGFALFAYTVARAP